MIKIDLIEDITVCIGPAMAQTIDGLQKPEVVSLSIWLAAPILPGTKTQIDAVLLDKLRTAPDSELKTLIQQNPGIEPELDAMLNHPTYLIRQMVDVQLRNNNVISGHYKHVDGILFPSPIVTSVVAQMLEANPSLTPQKIKLILIDTAKRLPSIEVDRQGSGIINPAAAVKLAYAFRKD